jgi:putative CocE/NonD family hydrolase
MEIVVNKNVPVRMRDGVELLADVYRPAGEGRFPALVQRSPYGKDASDVANMSFDLLRGVQAGYAIVNQDVRGCWSSGGEFTPYVDETRDGADTLQWVTRQSWSSGATGMIGASYYGATQWLAASESPAPGALAPYITASSFYDGWTYQGGAFQLGFMLSWTLRYLALGELMRRADAGDAGHQDLSSLTRAIDATPELFWRTPLTDVPELEDLAPYYQEWLAHPSFDGYWREIAAEERYEQIHAPALNIGGWYDVFQQGTVANYRGMKERGGSPRSRSPHLVMGPWSHSLYGGAFCDRTFGLSAAADMFDLTGYQLRWFDHHLRQIDNGVSRERPVKLFLMGADTWLEEDDWPLASTRWARWYLHSGGRANSSNGDGWLSTDQPDDERPDVYLYDPRDPVPTCGGATLLAGLGPGASGPRDQRSVEQRADVLVYTSGPLEAPVEVVGPVELVLFASSSAVDTDFTAKLVDVHPDGRAELLVDGILRARYRESRSAAKPLVPDVVVELRIDVGATANLFRAGHRIRLEVSSSNFPRFDRNTNTGNHIPDDTEADFIEAVNRVHHDRRHPSHLVLPVIER